jgi:ornithine cyclodeaminase/alanine dehydrogenase-like protein (mu-crystallin family)
MTSSPPPTSPGATPQGLPPIWIAESEVVALLTLQEAIAALEQSLEHEARGAAANMVKTHVVWNGNALHAIGATFPAAGFAGTKTWAHTTQGAAPVLALFDSHTGALCAIIEAFALGQLRTGGMSAVATRWLSHPTASVLAIIGSGRQAFTQAAAVAAVRNLTQVRVFSPTPAHCARFAEQLRAAFAFEVTVTESVEAAVADAPIVTLVTRARVPFLESSTVARGSHVNAIGAITPERSEFAPNLLARGSLVVADSVPAAQQLSRELIDYYGTDPRAWAAVRALNEIVAQGVTRPADADVTVFKAMGMGISDLALATEIYRRARAQRVGTALPARVRATIRLR